MAKLEGIRVVGSAMRMAVCGCARAGGLLVACVAASLALAQPAPARQYRVGVLNEAFAANHPTVEGLKAGLRQLGFVEGRDVSFEIRFTDGKREELDAAAKALVDSGVDVIFTSNEAATLAAKNASRNIPVIFTLVGDPVASGIVERLIRPGNNVTGVYDVAVQLTPKRMELLRAVQPKLRRVWFIYRAGNATDAAAVDAVAQAAKDLKLELIARAVDHPDQIVRILKEARKGDALLAPHVDEMNGSERILETSIKTRIPAIFPSDVWVTRGGLMSYGPNYYAQGVQAARIVAKVLQGSRPAELPVETAGDFELAVNLNTARLLRVSVPRTILFRANVFRQ
jgi:putative tryptophan/tyrosine transport system substrate-binding protein